MFSSVIFAVAAHQPGQPVRAVAELAERRGLTVEQLTVPDHRDAGEAIAEHVNDRDGALLVMSTSGTFLANRARRSVAGDVLDRLRRPVLLLGPHCVDASGVGNSALLIGVDPDDPDPAVAGVTASWRRTFGGGRPRLVDVVAESQWPAGATDEAQRERTAAIVDAYARRGVDGEPVVLRANDPAQALVELGDSVDGAVFALTTDRWRGHSHWYSTTRRVVQTSARPVLVVTRE